MNAHTCYNTVTLSNQSQARCTRRATRIVNVHYGPDTYYCAECAAAVYADAFVNHYPIVIRILRTLENEENER